MQTSPDSPTINPSPPLHALIWAFGRNLFATAKPQPRTMVTQARNDGSLAGHMQRLTVQQLVTAMRMQGLEGEDAHMLASLEALALAGEISFADFVVRVQNLFPSVLDSLDANLRVKVAVMALPNN